MGRAWNLDLHHHYHNSLRSQNISVHLKKPSHSYLRVLLESINDILLVEESFFLVNINVNLFSKNVFITKT